MQRIILPWRFLAARKSPETAGFSSDMELFLAPDVDTCISPMFY
jgi:hypothetical protein